MKEIIRLFGSEIYFTITELHEGRKFDFFPSGTFTLSETYYTCNYM